MSLTPTREKQIKEEFDEAFDHIIPRVMFDGVEEVIKEQQDWIIAKLHQELQAQREEIRKEVEGIKIQYGDYDYSREFHQGEENFKETLLALPSLTLNK